VEPSRLHATALPGIPLVAPGDDLTALILAGVAAASETLRDRDVLVVAQKIVSKAEGRAVDLRTVTPSPRARTLAAEVDKDPRLVELILAESDEILRTRPGLLIVQHRLGLVLANAGIDQSNIDGERVLLLPRDPDASAAGLRAAIVQRAGVDVGVVIADSIGRPFRLGSIGVAIGAAGIAALADLRGVPDLFGRPLRTTMVGVADELAACASLLMGQAAEGRPVVLLRGLAFPGETGARALVRAPREDLFR
jgi:coenzyme F420-0:L-glutamate ligase/coenzyme F420-1:gamma-L-glutamate ligase